MAANKACSSIPITGEFLGDLSLVSRIIEGGLDLALVAVDFKAIASDEVTDKGMSEIGSKLDNNSAAVEIISTRVSKMLPLVEKTKLDIKSGFKNVLDSIRRTEVETVVMKIKSFVQYFESEKERINGLSKEDLVTELEHTELLSYLRDSSTPGGDSLWVGMFDIVEQNYAIPFDKDDKVAFTALDALYNGSQTYLEVMRFLIEQYTYLSDHYYQKNNLNKYNDYIDLIKMTFHKFRYTFIGSKGLLDKVLSVYSRARNKDVGDIRKNLLGTQLDALHDTKVGIEDMELPLIMETPKNVIQISFEKFVSPPIGAWEKGKEVGYALQQENNGTYSKVSDWITLKVKEKANPILRLPVDQNRRKRLIFRRIGDQPPQLIGTILPYKTYFRDISRDVFNAAVSVHKDVAYNETKILVNNGGDVNVAFERERKAIHAAAQSGNHRITQEFILTNNDTDINAKDKSGYTPLHIASEIGKTPFVKMLIDEGADISVKTKEKLSTPLHLAAGKGFVKTVEVLSQVPEINLNEKDVEGFTPLHMAVIGGSKVVESLISNNGIDANARSILGLTPFHLAIMNQDVNVAKTIIKSGKADINAGDFDQFTALHFAAMKGHLNMVQFLLKQQDIDVNSQTSDSKWTPLNLALLYKREKVVEDLLKFDSTDVNLPVDENVTPLHIAVAVGIPKMVKRLIKRGAIIQKTTDGGLTPLHIAAVRRNVDIMSMLIDNGADVKATTNKNLTPLHFASIAGDVESIEILIKNGADIFQNTKENLTLLHLASSASNLDSMKYFIENGLDIEAKTKEHLTPLQLTVLDGKLGVLRYLEINTNQARGGSIGNLNALISPTDNIKEVKYLIQVGADTNVTTDQGLTLLHLACSVGNVAVAKFLIENGADINIKSVEGLTPLHSAASAGILESVKFLLERGADAYVSENEGNIFFYYIVRSGNLNLVKYVVEDQMFDINVEDNKREISGISKKSIVYWSVCDAVSYGKLEIVKYLVGTLKNAVCNPVYNAALIGNLDIVRYLVEEVRMYIDCSYDNEDERLVPLFGAIENNNLDIVKYLLCKGVDVNRSYNKLTALLLAVQKDRLNMVEYLTKKGANYNVLNEHGATLLHEAVLKNFDILKYLVGKNEIDINTRDIDGNTVLHYAALYDIPDKAQKVKYLCSQGADITVKNSMKETPDDVAKSSTLDMFSSCFEGVRMKRGINITENAIERTEIANDSFLPNLRYIEGSTQSKFLENYPTEHVNLNGTLLLLDTILKWMTNQKFSSVTHEPATELEAQADALTITEKLENLLKYHGDSSPEEQIDFSKVYSDIYKAINSGNKEDIPNILYSSINSFLSMKPEEIDELLSKMTI